MSLDGIQKTIKQSIYARQFHPHKPNWSIRQQAEYLADEIRKSPKTRFVPNNSESYKIAFDLAAQKLRDMGYSVLIKKGWGGWDVSIARQNGVA